MQSTAPTVLRPGTCYTPCNRLFAGSTSRRSTGTCDIVHRLLKRSRRAASQKAQVHSPDTIKVHCGSAMPSHAPWPFKDGGAHVAAASGLSSAMSFSSASWSDEKFFTPSASFSTAIWSPPCISSKRAACRAAAPARARAPRRAALAASYRRHAEHQGWHGPACCEKRSWPRMPRVAELDRPSSAAAGLVKAAGSARGGGGTWEADRSTGAPSPPPISGHSLRGSGSVLAASSPSSAGEIVMLSHLRAGRL